MRTSQLVVHIVGARPNYMKVAPVYAELERRGNVEQRLVHTGQHYDREVNDVFFSELPLPEPHAQLAVGSGSHAEQTARALVELSVARRVPIGNGVLTVDTDAQAWARARPDEADKGGDAARAALALVRLKRRLAED